MLYRRVGLDLRGVNSRDNIGLPLNRADGQRKVTGTALYAAEHYLPGMAYAVTVQSSAVKGRIKTIDTSLALSSPGVLDVVTWLNAPRLGLFEANSTNRPGQTHLVLQDDRILYQGQHIAILTAETFEQAQHAVSLLRVTYSEEAADTDIRQATGRAFKPEQITVIDAPEVDSQRGTPGDGFVRSPVQLDLHFTSTVENHNAMEPHATVAQWTGENLLLIDSTQRVIGTRNMVAAHLQIPPERIRVIVPFVGGGFGSKGNPWPHPTLAAIAAQRVNRPVKLVLKRQQIFAQVGHRPATLQRLRIGSTQEGQLLSLSHEVISGTSQFDDYVESAASTTRVAYSCANVETRHRITRLDLNTPCPMRAPGEALGNFVVETGIDELAYKVGLDPLELRLRNYAERDEDRGKRFSSKSLRECYAVASEQFGWENRPRAVRSTKEGDLYLGWGMASANFSVKLSAASARVQLHDDGRGTVLTASQDIGTGTYTSLAQLAGTELQIHPANIQVKLADTELPSAPASAGSQTSGSVGSAVVLAAREAIRRLMELAVTQPSSPFYGIDRSTLEVQGGKIRSANGQEISPKELLRLSGRKTLEAEATWTPTPLKDRTWSGFAFGAHFCEVAVDEELCHVHVRKWCSAFCAGRILNKKTACSQLRGGIVWGIGQALLEETIRDRKGRLVNNNLAEYLVPVQADVPDIGVILINEIDGDVNPAGAKGLGELGICGAAAAVANAIFHATGRRFRDLPIKPADWLAPVGRL